MSAIASAMPIKGSNSRSVPAKRALKFVENTVVLIQVAQLAP